MPSTHLMRKLIKRGVKRATNRSIVVPLIEDFEENEISKITLLQFHEYYSYCNIESDFFINTNIVFGITITIFVNGDNLL